MEGEGIGVVGRKFASSVAESCAADMVALSSVTLTATTSPSAATGTVTFLDNGSSIGTGTVSGGVAT